MATIPPPPSVDPALPMETPSKAPSPLAFTDYRYYWFARFTAVMATIAMVVVIGYQLYDTARSDYGMSIREASFQLGLLGLVQFLPLAVLTPVARSEEHTSELQSLMRISYACFCLKNKH